MRVRLNLRLHQIYQSPPSDLPQLLTHTRICLRFNRAVLSTEVKISVDEDTVLEELHHQEIVRIVLETGYGLNDDLFRNYDEKWRRHAVKVDEIQQILNSCV